jgi:malonate-semialdehyde dehydrogenase (acetylating)/methylmalonate-semialdehyde dehydrogenase
MSTTTTLTTIHHFINGAETTGEGDRTQPVYNPATGQVRLNCAWPARPI